LCKTHRCHKKEFLLKFARDRQSWHGWLFEAKKRYGLCVLNYIVTSNHIHLLVLDRGRGEIAKSMQLIAGRTAQEYSQRKSRRGAFREDRYNATAVDSQEYLARCMTYIDMNMVRAGVVKHPEQWPLSGFCEIQTPPARYAVIDQSAVQDILGFQEFGQLQRACREWVEEALRCERQTRESAWSESLAVGRREFVEQVKAELGARGMHRTTTEAGHVHALKEPATAYGVHSAAEMVSLSGNNTIFLG
jgi:putative transposase